MHVAFANKRRRLGSVASGQVIYAYVHICGKYFRQTVVERSLNCEEIFEQEQSEYLRLAIYVGLECYPSHTSL
jgi:hypothetical protein